MCGISGFSLSENAQVNARRVAKAMLLDIESRGHDATGFAFLDPTGTFQIHKAPLTASTFVRRRLCLPKRTATVVLHTRAATQGSEKENSNNHPIPAGRLVGVHNGIIWNDDELWRELGQEFRTAEVDSEVIFAMLAHDTSSTPTDVLSVIEGPAAVAWLNQDEPDRLYLARANSNPLIIGQTADGSLLFASTESAVVDGAKAGGLELTHIRETNEGTLLTVEHGHIENVETFTPAPTYTSRRYAYHYPRSFHSQTWDDEYEDMSSRKSAKESAEVFEGTVLGVDEWVSDWIDRDVFTPLYSIPGYGDLDDYLDIYQEREVAIDEWMFSFRGDENALRNAMSALKTHARPGGEVTTKLDDRVVRGTILALPMQFPGGKFLLRLRVPKNIGYQSEDDEYVLVERAGWEFSLLTKEVTRALSD